jgi:CDP-4-dehydro-6-deoxyglucose reductase, E1
MSLVGRLVCHQSRDYVIVSDGEIYHLVEWPLTGRNELIAAERNDLEILSGSAPKEEMIPLLRKLASQFAKSHYQVAHVSHLTDDSPLIYAGRIFDEEEVHQLSEASLDFWLTEGRFTRKFERQFSRYLGTRFSLLVNSGSSANLLAFMALTSARLGDRRIKRGDEVITVAAAFPTTVAPIVQYGAVPVFVDITPNTYNLDVSQLEEACSSKTKAVMVAHTMGNPFDLQAVINFCRKNKLWLVEDNCDALGSQYQTEEGWRMTGTIGDIGTSSFHPPHHMTMGEGGAVYTRDKTLFKILRSLRSWGKDCWCPSGRDNTCKKRFDFQLGNLPYGYDHKYTFSHFGYNLKATDLQAAIGCAQLRKLPSFVEAREANWNTLNSQMQKWDSLFELPKATPRSRPSWFGYVLTLKDSAPFSRTQLVRELERQGIQTRMLFSGNILRHPCFVEAPDIQYRVPVGLAQTEQIIEKTFWVGVYPGLQEPQMKRIAKVIDQFIYNYEAGR